MQDSSDAAPAIAILDSDDEIIHIPPKYGSKHKQNGKESVVPSTGKTKAKNILASLHMRQLVSK